MQNFSIDELRNHQDFFQKYPRTLGPKSCLDSMECEICRLAKILDRFDFNMRYWFYNLTKESSDNGGLEVETYVCST